MAARLRWMIDGDPEPDASDWQAMGMALWDGDPLADEVAAGRFRADLFYRLQVVDLSLPPLRAHKPDIPALVAQVIEGSRLRELYHAGVHEVADAAGGAPVFLPAFDASTAATTTAAPSD